MAEGRFKDRELARCRDAGIAKALLQLAPATGDAHFNFLHLTAW